MNNNCANYNYQQAWSYCDYQPSNYGPECRYRQVDIKPNPDEIMYDDELLMKLSVRELNRKLQGLPKDQGMFLKQK
jgi:hypothetical protein